MARRIGKASGAVATVILTLAGVALAVGGSCAVARRPSPSPAPVAGQPPTTPQDAHKRANDVPVSLSIPSVGIAAKVVPTGRTRVGAMAVTADPQIADWFKPGTYPGDVGSAVIAGHSGFARSSAAFDPMPRIRRGALVYVMTDKGQRLTFKVIDARDYPADAQAPEVFGRNDGRYLNLVSCTGSFNTGLGTHNLRLVVFTRLVE